MHVYLVTHGRSYEGTDVVGIFEGSSDGLRKAYDLLSTEVSKLGQYSMDSLKILRVPLNTSSEYGVQYHKLTIEVAER